MRQKLSVLIYHRVLPQKDPLQPSIPTAAQFEGVMRWLKRWFNVLPLAEAHGRLREGTLPVNAVAVTFDDGYADNFEVALPILRRLGLPATFFVASGFTGGGRMWNDTIIETLRQWPRESISIPELGLANRATDTWESKRQTLDDVLRNVKYLPIEERDKVVEGIAGKACGALPALMMSREQVRELHEYDMEIGGHTCRHPILASLSDQDARREIEEGRRQLEDMIDDRVRLFAYPNGRPGKDFVQRHADMVRELGFDAAFTTKPGPAVRDVDSFQIPRFTPWDRSPARFALRLQLSRYGMGMPE